MIISIINIIKSMVYFKYKAFIMIQKKQPLLITTGEPAGIGMDVVLLLAAENKLQDFARPIWVTADADAMTERAKELTTAGVLKVCPSWQTVDAHIDEDDFLERMSEQAVNSKAAFILINTPCAAPVISGQINTSNSAMVANQLDIAHKLAFNNTVAAIVTGPLQKSHSLMQALSY